jgi:hypothetical protein
MQTYAAKVNPFLNWLLHIGNQYSLRPFIGELCRWRASRGSFKWWFSVPALILLDQLKKGADPVLEAPTRVGSGERNNQSKVLPRRNFAERRLRTLHVFLWLFVPPIVNDFFFGMQSSSYCEWLRNRSASRCCQWPARCANTWRYVSV